MTAKRADAHLRNDSLACNKSHTTGILTSWGIETVRLICLAAILCLASTLAAQSNSLTTNFNGATTGGNGGNVFDLAVNSSDVSITKFDVHMSATTAQTVNVYYKVGTYAGSQTTPAAWTLHESVSTVGLGAGNPTPVSLTTPLTLTASTTYGIAIVAQTTALRYNSISSTVTYSDANITLSLGAQVTTNFASSIANREWNGTVHYSLAGAGGPIVYNENFENAATFSSWTLTPATNNLWHRTNNGGNPNYCLGYCQGETAGSATPNGNFNTVVGVAVPNTGIAASPAITLTGGTYYALILDFFHQGENDPAYDVLTIGIGTTPAVVTTVLYSSGTTHSYAREAWDISSFAGQTIYIIFTFDSVDETDNNFPGSRIDNIIVEASTTTDPTLEAPTVPSTTGTPVMITEFTTNTGSDALEIQNVTNATFDATGWQVIISNSYTAIDSANTITKTLGSMSPLQVMYWTDSASTNYWGNNIFWDPTGKGWIMIVDPAGNVRDFVAFNWDATSIASMSVSAGGFSGLNPGSGWNGAGVNDTGAMFARVGTADNDDLTDWQNNGSANSWGTTNSGLAVPFTAGTTVALGGTDPNFTGHCVVGDSLGLMFEASDPQAYDTVTITVSVTGGSLTASQAGFTQSFPYQASGYAGPVVASVGGTATTDGTIVLTIQASDGTNTDSYTLTLTIDPPPEPEIDVLDSTSSSIPSGTTQTISNALPAGFAENVSYTIENQDTGDLELTGTPPVAFANEQNCAVSINQPGATTIAGNGSETFSIDLTPTAAGAWSVDITIDNNDANEDPYTFTVAGTAYDPQPEIDVQRGGNSIAVGANDTVAGTQAGTYMLLTYAIWNLDFGTLNLTGTPPVVISAQTNCSAVVGLQPANTSIGPNASTTCDVDLTPTAAGAWSFVITIDNNDSNENPYTFTVEGTAQVSAVPEIDLQRPSGTSIAVGGTDTVNGTVMAVVTSITYTIENLGGVDLDLPNSVQLSNLVNCAATLTQAPATPVASGTTTTFTIDITPAAAGAWSFDASIDNNDSNENPYTWQAAGNAQATPAPEIDVQRPQGTSIPAGGTDAGLTATSGVTFTLTYTVENQGSADLNLTGTPAVVIAGAVNCTAGVSAQPSTPVGAQSNTTFTIDVTATAAGGFSFGLSIDSDDANENPYTVTVSGTAQTAPAPEIDVQRLGTSIPVGTSHNVSNSTAGAAINLDFRVENQGSADLDLGGSPPVQLGGFTNCSATIISQPASPVSPAGSATFTIEVTPQSVGAWSFTASIANNDANENPYDFAVNGNAQPTPSPEIEVRRDGATAEIGNGGVDERMGLSGTQVLRYAIHNTGTGPLTVASVTVSDFVDCTATVTQQPFQTIGSGGLGVFEIEVQAPSSGGFSFQVTITNNDADENPYVFDFQGTTFTKLDRGSKKEDDACSANPAAHFTWPLVALLAVVFACRRRIRATGQ